MSDPRIADPVTEKLLQRVLASNGASHPGSNGASNAASNGAAQPAAHAAPRMVDVREAELGVAAAGASARDGAAGRSAS